MWSADLGGIRVLAYITAQSIEVHLEGLSACNWIMIHAVLHSQGSCVYVCRMGKHATWPHNKGFWSMQLTFLLSLFFLSGTARWATRCCARRFGFFGRFWRLCLCYHLRFLLLGLLYCSTWSAKRTDTKEDEIILNWQQYTDPSIPPPSPFNPNITKRKSKRKVTDLFLTIFGSFYSYE